MRNERMKQILDNCDKYRKYVPNHRYVGQFRGTHVYAKGNYFFINGDPYTYDGAVALLWNYKTNGLPESKIDVESFMKGDH